MGNASGVAQRQQQRRTPHSSAAAKRGSASASPSQHRHIRRRPCAQKCAQPAGGFRINVPKRIQRCLRRDIPLRQSRCSTPVAHNCFSSEQRATPRAEAPSLIRAAGSTKPCLTRRGEAVANNESLFDRWRPWQGGCRRFRETFSSQSLDLSLDYSSLLRGDNPNASFCTEELQCTHSHFMAVALEGIPPPAMKRCAWTVRASFPGLRR